MFEKSKLKKQIKTLEVEVENGNPEAMYELAMIYLDGSVIKSDKKKADELMQKSADLGFAKAKTHILANKITKSMDIVADAISEIKNIK